MKRHLIARCDRVRPNNGIVEVFFTTSGLFGQQDQQALFNLIVDPAEQEQEGEYYEISIQPPSGGVRSGTMPGSSRGRSSGASQQRPIRWTYSKLS